jgi:HPt (histidine-containing phosphotransfer) domain-containing protein
MTEEEFKKLDQLRAEDYQRHELVRKVTEALHKLYPHSKSLTTRDLGQVCQMAEDEIIQSRKAIQRAIQRIKQIASQRIDLSAHHESMVADVLDILRPVDPEDRKIRLTKIDFDPDVEEEIGKDKYPALYSLLYGRSSDDGLDEVHNDLRKLVQNYRFK